MLDMTVLSYLAITIAWVISMFLWGYLLKVRLPNAEKNIEGKIVERVPQIVEQSAPYVKQAFRDEIPAIKEDIKHEIKTEIDNFKKDLPKVISKELPVIAESLLNDKNFFNSLMGAGNILIFGTPEKPETGALWRLKQAFFGKQGRDQQEQNKIDKAIISTMAEKAGIAPQFQELVLDIAQHLQPDPDDNLITKVGKSLGMMILSSPKGQETLMNFTKGGNAGFNFPPRFPPYFEP